MPNSLKRTALLLPLNLFALTALAAACLSPLCAKAQGKAQQVSVASLVHEQTDLSRLPLLHDWISNLQSSYDRSGGNGDAGNFLSGDAKEGVMADMDGPGSVVRIWSANPQGQIKIYIDGSQTPTLDTQFQSLFDGSLAPFKLGLTGKSSGGFYTYLPIPYARHCRIVLDNGGGVYYHVNYLTFPAGTSVRSFSLPLAAQDQAALDAANAVWAGASMPVPLKAVTRSVASGQRVALGNYKGAAVVRRITLAAPGVSDSDLRRLVLRATFDNHATPDIEAPVADFFGNAYGRKPFQTLLLDCANDGTLGANFPMPFARSAHFTLENGTSHPVSIAWAAEVNPKPFYPAAEGYFHALWTQEVTQRGKPHVWATISGQRGRFVGIVQTMKGHGGLGFLEGDDQFRVDNQTWLPSQIPSTVVGPWNGTGTEDCFNSGWYFDGGPVALPVNALLMKDDHLGEIDCLRWFLDDAPTFQKSVDGQIEHGGANDAPGVYYSSVSYWYSDGPVKPWFAMPAASRITTLPPPPPDFVVPHAIEGESLAQTATASGGSIQGQEMNGFGYGWSHSAQLFWSSGQKQNDTLTLTVSPPAAGAYDLYGYFTKAPDYGQVTFQVNGKPLAASFDGYAARVVPSGPVALGSVMLPSGPSTVVVTLTGKNDASSGYQFGLDALTFNAPGSIPTPLPATASK